MSETTETRALKALRDLREEFESKDPTFKAASTATRNAELVCLAARENLRQKREDQHIGQKALATRLDMSQSAISKFENGHGDVGLKLLARIADGVGSVPLVLFVSQTGIADVRKNPSAIMEVLQEAHEQLNRQLRSLIPVDAIGSEDIRQEENKSFTGSTKKAWS